jgi:hypothetical protein
VHGSLARAGKVKGQTPKVSESNLALLWMQIVCLNHQM